MKIKVIGCGNAFSIKNYNQSFILEEDGKKMMIDCGWTTPLALKNAGINVKEIDSIYISHLHADHVGGLEYMAFIRYDWMNRPERCLVDSSNNYAPKLYGNDVLLKDLWEKSLRGGLESMEGFVSSIDTFFHIIPMPPNQPMYWQGWKLNTIQQIHIMSGSSISWTFGLLIEKPGHKSVYFTTDSQHCSPRQMEIFYEKADLIFQDCECTPFMSGVHANYIQLAGYPEANSIKLPDTTKKKMILSHYQDFVSDNKDFYGKECNWESKAQDDGFLGFAKVGAEYEV